MAAPARRFAPDGSFHSPARAFGADALEIRESKSKVNIRKKRLENGCTSFLESTEVHTHFVKMYLEFLIEGNLDGSYETM